MKFFPFSQRKSGSSFLSPAHGCGGARATNINNNSPSAKKSGEARKQAGKKEGGLGEGIFARLLCPPKAGWGWENISAIPALAGRQNRKIFVSLIEKILGGMQLKMLRKIFCFARRSEAEAGGNAGRDSIRKILWILLKESSSFVQ